MACAAGLVVFPTLFSGFFFDDYIHLMTLEGDGYGATPFDLFLFGAGDPERMKALIRSGPYPWYTLPDLQIHFFRPLSSAGMWLDNSLFGRHAVFYHLHSLGWYALLAWAAALVYRRVLPLPIAGLAALLYVLDAGHVVPALWWSNRNALVSAAPALLGLAAHLRWREAGWRPGLPLSLVGYGLGLLGGETALGICGYLFAYELAGRRDALWTRLRALAPASVLAALYLAGYKWAGYGVFGSGVYFDPVGEWRPFLAHAPGRLLDLFGTQFFRLPAELAVVRSDYGVALRVAAAALAPLLLAAAYHTWRRLAPDERRTMAWLGTGAVVASVPALATFPSGRLLTLPSVGACALAAMIIYHGAGMAREAAAGLHRAVAHTFVLLHVLYPPFVWIGTGAVFPIFLALSEDAFRTMEIDNRRAPAQFIVSLSAADPYTGFYPQVMRRALGFEPAMGWQTLSLAPLDHEVIRTAGNRFELRVLGGELLATPFERLVRSAAYPFRAGDRVDLGEYEIEVLEAGEWGPKRIGVTFNGPLENPDYLFLAWKGGRLRNFSWPPVGEPVVLPVREGYFAWPNFKKQLGLL